MCGERVKALTYTDPITAKNCFLTKNKNKNYKTFHPNRLTCVFIDCELQM